jgi:hypothetical protein
MMAIKRAQRAIKREEAKKERRSAQRAMKKVKRCRAIRLLRPCCNMLTRSECFEQTESDDLLGMNQGPILFRPRTDVRGGFRLTWRSSSDVASRRRDQRPDRLLRNGRNRPCIPFRNSSPTD